MKIVTPEFKYSKMNRSCLKYLTPLKLRINAKNRQKSITGNINDYILIYLYLNFNRISPQISVNSNTRNYFKFNAYARQVVIFTAGTKKCRLFYRIAKIDNIIIVVFLFVSSHLVL